MKPLSIAPGAGDTGRTPVLRKRLRGREVETSLADVALETAVAFEYNGVSHAVMLATPCDLEDFALGFSLSEGIVGSPADLYGVEWHSTDAGITLEIEIATSAFALLKEKRRTLVGRTGCGICGAENLKHVLRPLPSLQGCGPQIDVSALAVACTQLDAAQQLQRATGAAHGAVWCTPEGHLLAVREDIGRHNALDKLVGALARAGTATRCGFGLVTSRASVEMVQKAAMAGITLLAAVSAPTALAVRVAENCGLTLVGFARGAECSIYTHPWRIRP